MGAISQVERGGWDRLIPFLKYGVTTSRIQNTTNNCFSFSHPSQFHHRDLHPRNLAPFS